MIDAVTLSSLARGLSSFILGWRFAASPRALLGADAAGQTSFLDVMKNAATSMVNDVKGAEAMSFQGIAGKVSTREVVDAVMSADRSLQTAIAIRDKVVSAYLDITKMPI